MKSTINTSRRIRSITLFTFALFCFMQSGLAKTTYEFCVTNPHLGPYRVKVTTTIDFGRQAAKYLALKKVRPLMRDQISISTYNPKHCSATETLEVRAVNIDGKIAETLLNNPTATPAAIAEAVDALAEDTIQIVKSPEKIVTKPAKEVKRAVERPVKEVKRFFRKIF